MGSQRLLVLIGLEVLVMMTWLKNIVISSSQGLLMLIGSKFLIKMTRLEDIVLFILMFCGRVILIKNFDPLNIRRPWTPEITKFCSEFIMTKTFKPIKARRLGCPFDFISFSARPVLVLGHSFFNTWGYLVRFHFSFWSFKVRVRFFNDFLL